MKAWLVGNMWHSTTGLVSVSLSSFFNGTIHLTDPNTGMIGMCPVFRRKKDAVKYIAGRDLKIYELTTRGASHV